MTERHLSAAQARRMALAAQGFSVVRPAGRIDVRHLRAVLQMVGVLQIDSVNVFCRAHYLPMFSRLGPYPRELLDRMSGYSQTNGGGDSTAQPRRGAPGARRTLFEYWAHEASLIPAELRPLLRWRMERASVDAWGDLRALARDRPQVLEQVAELVAQAGPIRAADTAFERPARSAGQMWNWHDGKMALEYLFWAGRVTAAYRVNFERRYDLADRVLPCDVIATPSPTVDDAQRELVRIAAKACGVATESDLGDYFRLPRAESKARVAELVARGELEPVRVEGWTAPAYLWPAARRPRRMTARALLSPFDSLIWCRARVERLFNFRYRVEIYTPAAKRQYGYYVLPFLLGESLVARVDLKSDRQAGVLRVQGAYGEVGIDRSNVSSELATELACTAKWLGLDGVQVMPRGDLASELARRC